LSTIALPSLDTHDLARISRLTYNIHPRERSRAQHLLQKRPFKAWMVGPRSRELLVHGDFADLAGAGGTRYASPLSVFCATVVTALRSRQVGGGGGGGGGGGKAGGGGYVALVFFCGSHVEKSESPGPAAMLRSFIAQLLSQTSIGATTGLESTFNIEGAKNGEISSLCAIFNFLVNRLPEQTKLFCIIDGVSYYEGNKFEADMLVTLRCLLELVAESAGARSAVKVLVTSPWATDRVRGLFRDSRFVSLAGTEPVGDLDAALLDDMAGLGLRRSTDSSDDDDEEEEKASESKNDEEPEEEDTNSDNSDA
jgi:hypothetical protein